MEREILETGAAQSVSGQPTGQAAYRAQESEAERVAAAVREMLAALVDQPFRGPVCSVNLEQLPLAELSDSILAERLVNCYGLRHGAVESFISEARQQIEIVRAFQSSPAEIKAAETYAAAQQELVELLRAPHNDPWRARLVALAQDYLDWRQQSAEQKAQVIAQDPANARPFQGPAFRDHYHSCLTSHLCHESMIAAEAVTDAAAVLAKHGFFDRAARMLEEFTALQRGLLERAYRESGAILTDCAADSGRANLRKEVFSVYSGIGAAVYRLRTRDSADPGSQSGEQAPEADQYRAAESWDAFGEARLPIAAGYSLLPEEAAEPEAAAAESRPWWKFW